ncbi:MAG: hypothetical protein KGD73_08705 [Candidatus Lokiarchaeota archaeon]|nr:hypothetical protein [Candidatus Lokiarchaeota archaeon]
MVFKNISRIKAALPEVMHVIMFYDNGTIFQTTFEQDINIPKLGENLTEVINHMRRIYEISQISLKSYEKIIFETDNISIMILKLGEESNIALFFKKEEDDGLKINNIRRYLKRIEDMIDMDKLEIGFQEILIKEEELKKLEEKGKEIQEIINDLREKEFKINKEELNQKISSSTDEYEKHLVGIDKLKEEILLLKSKFQQKPDSTE